MILTLNKVTKKFGSFTAVKNVSFELKAGERVGLIGANGAGKTTISEMIAGINTPTSGTITYGFEYKNKPQEGIGMQFQDSTYPSGLTVKDIVTFARNLHKVEISNGELRDVLESFQMEEFYNRRARSLSGGQRQKLNILLSVIHKPRLVILDELSTGLDIAAREDIIQFTDKLLTKNNIAAILISHHMAEIKALCDKVIVLDRGQIQKVATIKEIEKEFGSLDDYMKTLIRDKNKQARSNANSPYKIALKEFNTAKRVYKKDKTEKNKHAFLKAKETLNKEYLDFRTESKANKKHSKIEAKAQKKQAKADKKAMKENHQSMTQMFKLGKKKSSSKKQQEVKKPSETKPLKMGNKKGGK